MLHTAITQGNFGRWRGAAALCVRQTDGVKRLLRPGRSVIAKAKGPQVGLQSLLPTWQGGGSQ